MGNAVRASEKFQSALERGVDNDLMLPVIAGARLNNLHIAGQRVGEQSKIGIRSDTLLIERCGLLKCPFESLVKKSACIWHDVYPRCASNFGMAFPGKPLSLGSKGICR